jgi:protein-S-isoprenylcysteine O-methyltransferase Ste14
VNTSIPRSSRRASVGLAMRGLLWTILFPGTVTGFVPLLFFGLGRGPLDGRSFLSLAGGSLIVAGAALLVACIVEFGRSGRGTLSPVDPPRHLVVRGLYRYVRNPMYLGVTTVLLGEAIMIRSASLAIYGGSIFLVVNLFVVVYEEPTLRQQFGLEYDDYARRVGRWVPRLSSHEDP